MYKHCCGHKTFPSNTFMTPLLPLPQALGLSWSDLYHETLFLLEYYTSGIFDDWLFSLSLMLLRFILLHLSTVTFIVSLFYFILWRYYNIFLESPVDEHLDYFQVLTGKKTKCYKYSYTSYLWTYLFISLGEIPKSGWLLHIVCVQIYKEPLNCFPKQLVIHFH